VIADPRSVHTDPRLRALGELAVLVTLEPWSLSSQHHQSWLAAGLTDDDLLHAIMLSAYFGHLNRIADAVAVPLDYIVQLPVPAADPTVPPLAPSPVAITGRPAIDPARRPATTAAITAWRTYMFERDAPLTRRQRTVLARWVSHFLGDGGISSPDDLTANPIDTALRELAEVVTLAPWQLADASFTTLRSHGLDDAALFDACAVASSAGTFSRITVALAAMARDRA
jgi:alkylhydroperoxidase family enzyme